MSKATINMWLAITVAAFLATAALHAASFSIAAWPWDTLIWPLMMSVFVTIVPAIVTHPKVKTRTISHHPLHFETEASVGWADSIRGVPRPLVAAVIALGAYTLYCGYLQNEISIDLATEAWTPTALRAVTAAAALFHAMSFVLFYSAKKYDPMLP